jgi:GNAT superfamily N-acetyltransferase
MKKITNEEINKIISDINPNFVSHLMEESWGYSVFIMENLGRVYAHVYWYNDDPDTIYLEGLSVEKDAREEGLGNKLLKMLEKIAISLGATTTSLWVYKNKWLYNWYKRNDYKYYMDHDLKNAVWMKKSLK